MKAFIAALLLTVCGLLITKMLIDHHWGKIAEQYASQASQTIPHPPVAAKPDQPDQTTATVKPDASTLPPILKVEGAAAPAQAHAFGQMEGQQAEDNAINELNALPVDPTDNQPIVPLAVARAALEYVGSDAYAEAVWMAAINDPNMPARDRQSLIEGLAESGLSNAEEPTEDDLPIIENRLNMIEQIGPGAMDEVNSAAFNKAYDELAGLEDKLAARLNPAPQQTPQ